MVTAIMMLYINTKVMVRSSKINTDFFDIDAGIKQGELIIIS